MYFPKLKLTNEGRALIVKGMSGAEIHFTRFALGDGEATGDWRAMTGMAHQRAVMAINSIELGTDCVVLEATYSNADQQEDMEARELGVFAQGTDKREVLYAYANAGERAAHVPANSEEATVQETFHLAIAVGDAENVTATIGEYSGYASKAELADHVNDHRNPHHVTAEEVGLGNVPNVTPADQRPVFESGYYETSDGELDVQNITSGEKLGVMLRKVRTAIAAFIGHSHDNRYYTESEIDSKLSGLQTAGHKHAASDITSGVLPVVRGGTGAGTAAEALGNLGGMPTGGGTFDGRVNFAGGTSYYVDETGNANFKQVYGALYNDYAEFMPRGEETEPGDIVALDVFSNAERYVKATQTNCRVAGVHSDEFAHIIGGEAAENGEDYIVKNMERYIPVGVAGRVRVRVIGRIRTGDWIVPSEIPGVGRALHRNDLPEAVVGYAVECDMRNDLRRLRVRLGR